MKRIHFEDDGQDFLSWLVDDQGYVIESEPFQTWVWAGYQVLALNTVRRGHLLNIKRPSDGEIRVMKHAVLRVQHIDTSARAAVHV